MKSSSVIVAALAALVTVAAAADDVYLQNGRSFEGVIAEVGETKVRIQMPFGQISLSREDVLRVEKSDSALEEYLERKGALQRSADASAEDWLELARWARANGLDHSAREAGLVAAVLDPQLDGLAVLLRPMGYVLDETLERWVPYEEYMRRNGFVLREGQWISQREHAEQVLAAEESRRRQREAEAKAAEASLVRELRSLVELQILSQAQQATTAAVYPGGVPVVVASGWFLPPIGFHHPHGRKVDLDRKPRFRGRPPVHPVLHGARHHISRSNILTRQPGSLIPVTFGGPKAASHRHGH